MASHLETPPDMKKALLLLKWAWGLWLLLYLAQVVLSVTALVKFASPVMYVVRHIVLFGKIEEWGELASLVCWIGALTLSVIAVVRIPDRWIRLGLSAFPLSVIAVKIVTVNFVGDIVSRDVAGWKPIFAHSMSMILTGVVWVSATVVCFKRSRKLIAAGVTLQELKENNSDPTAPTRLAVWCWFASYAGFAISTGIDLLRTSEVALRYVPLLGLLSDPDWSDALTTNTTAIMGGNFCAFAFTIIAAVRVTDRSIRLRLLLIPGALLIAFVPAFIFFMFIARTQASVQISSILLQGCAVIPTGIFVLRRLKRLKINQPAPMTEPRAPAPNTVSPPRDNDPEFRSAAQW